MNNKFKLQSIISNNKPFIEHSRKLILILILLLFCYCSSDTKFNHYKTDPKIEDIIQKDTSDDYKSAIKLIKIKLKNSKENDDYNEYSEFLSVYLVHCHIKIALDIAAEYSDFKKRKDFTYHLNEAACYIDEKKHIASSFEINPQNDIMTDYNLLKKLVIYTNMHVIYHDNNYLILSKQIAEELKKRKNPHPLRYYYYWRALEYGNIKSRLFKRALNTKISSILAMYDLSTIFYLTKKTLNAIESFSTLLQMNPKHLNSISSLSLIYIQIGNLDKALKMLKDALKIDKYHTGINHNLGFVYYSKKKYKLALDFFLKVLDRNSKRIHTILLIADTYKKLKDYVNAKKWINFAETLSDSYEIQKRVKKIKDHIERMEKIKYSNNIGISLKNPIKIEFKGDLSIAINAIEDYITDKYGFKGIDWYIIQRKQIKFKDKYIEYINIYIKKTKDKKDLYFDITDLYKGID